MDRGVEARARANEDEVLESLSWLQEHPTFQSEMFHSHLPTTVRLHFQQVKGGPIDIGVQQGAFCESAECFGELQQGIIGWGSRGEPKQACCVPLACAAHTNWVALRGFTVMKPPLSDQAEKSSLFICKCSAA